MSAFFKLKVSTVVDALLHQLKHQEILDTYHLEVGDLSKIDLPVWQAWLQDQDPGVMKSWKWSFQEKYPEVMVQSVHEVGGLDDLTCLVTFPQYLDPSVLQSSYHSMFERTRWEQGFSANMPWWNKHLIENEADWTLVDYKDAQYFLGTLFERLITNYTQDDFFLLTTLVHKIASSHHDAEHLLNFNEITTNEYESVNPPTRLMLAYYASRVTRQHAPCHFNDWSRWCEHHPHQADQALQVMMILNPHEICPIKLESILLKTPKNFSIGEFMPYKNQKMKQPLQQLMSNIHPQTTFVELPNAMIKDQMLAWGAALRERVVPLDNALHLFN